MKHRVCLFLLVGIAMTALGIGCAHEPRKRLNAPPQGFHTEHPVIHDYYVYEHDQAMLEDCSITDFHFVPHTADLSGSGEARLARFAELLASSGGTIHYDTAMSDPKLVRARLARAEAFLAETVPSAEAIDVMVGLPGGSGMDAKEAAAAAKIARDPEKRATAYALPGVGG